MNLQKKAQLEAEFLNRQNRIVGLIAKLKHKPHNFQYVIQDVMELLDYDEFDLAKDLAVDLRTIVDWKAGGSIHYEVRDLIIARWIKQLENSV